MVAPQRKNSLIILLILASTLVIFIAIKRAKVKIIRGVEMAKNYWGGKILSKNNLQRKEGGRNWVGRVRLNAGKYGNKNLCCRQA